MRLTRFAGRISNESGFTLLEIMIAVFLLTIALLGLMSVTVMVINGNSFSKAMTTATTLAKDKLEELQNTSYTSIASSTAAETKESIYQRSWTVTNNSPATNMKTVVVTVTWPWQGQTRNVTLQTIIASK